MIYKQAVMPRINIPARRGWCLQYVDDGVNAPSRKPDAMTSFRQEQKNGNIRMFDLPVGVWIPGYLAFDKGIYQPYGHVFWAYKHPDGRVELHDSEVHAGARKPYGSLAELLAWFGAYSPRFIGWTLGIDGVHVVNELPDPVPTPPTDGRKPAKGTATVIVDALNVRTEPSTTSQVVATYKKGETVNYDSFIIANGYVWLSYIGGSGNRRYIAEGPANGNAKDVYVRGGVSK